MTHPLPVPPRHPRRLVYLGTPAMAVPPLEALHAAGFEIALVVTGADKRRGRRAEPTPTPVKAAALALGLPVTHDLDEVAAVGADLGVVVAYGRIIRRPLLDALAMVNLHFSLLPRWRGAAPVQRALLAGDACTGVCVMALEEGLDTGGVYARAELPIDAEVTAAELGRHLTGLGSDLLVRTLLAGINEPEAQVGEPTYAHKLGPDDLHLRWDRPAAELHRLVRVGGAWTQFRGKRLKIVGATTGADDVEHTGAPGELIADGVQTGDGVLHLTEVQPEGKAPMPVADWRNGAQPRPGERLGATDDDSTHAGAPT